MHLGFQRKTKFFKEKLKIHFILIMLKQWFLDILLLTCSSHIVHFFKFYLGKMKTIAQETAFHITLRNCSREVRYRSVYMWFWWRGSTWNQARIFFFFAEGFCRSWGVVITMKELSDFLDRKYKNWAHKIGSWKYLTIWRPVVPVFPRAKSASFLFCTVNSFQGVLKVSGYSSTLLNPCRGRWQVPICSWHY